MKLTLSSQNDTSTNHGRLTIMHRPVTTVLLLILLPPVFVGAQRPAADRLRPSASIFIEAESLAGSVQTTHGRAVVQDMRPFGPGWGGDA